MERGSRRLIDEAAIYDHALTPDRVLAHHNESKQPFTNLILSKG
jgi:hypothetical protein